MFTGIITDTTAIKSSKLTDDGLRLTFIRPASWQDMQLGESVATNGVCLTVADLRASDYDCLLVPETLSKTSFGSHLPARVNLERSLSVKDKFGGHFVQGHVDCTGTVVTIDASNSYQLFVDFPVINRDLVIPKGSITIDGVSLTVASLLDHSLGVALIPHTLATTTLKELRIGDSVNLEFDMIGKYVVNIMEHRQNHATS